MAVYFLSCRMTLLLTCLDSRTEISASVLSFRLKLLLICKIPIYIYVLSMFDINEIIDVTDSN